MTTDVIEEYIDSIGWHWGILSENEDLDLNISFVKKHLDKHWYWNVLSWRFPLDTITENSDLQWDWQVISDREDLTMEFIEKHTDKPLNWANLTYKFPFDSAFIEKYPNIPYNWQVLSQRIPLAYILANNQFPWDWEYVTDNKDITMDFITNNHDKNLNWGEIINFKFDNEYKKIYDSLTEKYKQD